MAIDYLTQKCTVVEDRKKASIVENFFEAVKITNDSNAEVIKIFFEGELREGRVAFLGDDGKRHWESKSLKDLFEI